MSHSFTASQFRKKALLSQGLLQKDAFGRGKNAVLRAIQHLGYIQIDTISVVERAHHHVLWSRVSNYQPVHLSSLIIEKQVFEYWFHAAAYLPMNEFRFALPRMHAIKSGKKHWFANTDPKLMRQILQRIKTEGPLMARDFEDPPRGANGWWEWKPAKQALEQLFIQGDLMVVERQGFQKKYDLMERALPPQIDTKCPTLEEQARYFVDVTLRAHGFAALKSYTYLRKGAELRKVVKEVLEQDVTEKRLLKSALPCGTTVYCDLQMTSRKQINDRVVLLSPFDNMVIQRERCRRIFGFDYQIECYVPKAKRQFGYFCLPVLYKDRLIGRVDCKADRQTFVLHVVALYLEERLSECVLRKLADALYEFMQFNQCGRIMVKKVNPSGVQKKLVALLKKQTGSDCPVCF